MATFEKWVWTDLLAFDVTQDDCGAAGYLELLGFVPEGISILISSPDMVLQHEGVEEDEELPPDFCSRNGHEGNEMRRRQIWTRHRLRHLVHGLRSAGARVFLSNFTRHHKDRFHREWMSEHPECRITWVDGPKDALFVLTRMANGTLLQDYFASQLVRVCNDYGFDGWHGPDGYGPMTAITRSDFGDDFFGQFLSAADRGEVPWNIAAPAGSNPEKLACRRDWIWRHRRAEWISFYTDRWSEFWKTVTDALHGIGRKTMINSAWTRDPFEAIYRYGIDYRKIAAAGVDAILVETAAGGVLLGSQDRDYHYDYLAMLLHMGACVPQMKMLFLHNTKDVVEDWDLLRHAPPMLEREVYALANVFYAEADGRPRRCVHGLLACLGDGITSTEWEWLGKQWRLAFSDNPRRVHGATLVWADSILDGQIAAFGETRDASTHWLTYRLLERNAPIQIVAPISTAASLKGPLLVLNPHHLSLEEREVLLQSGKPLIAIGPDFAGWPAPSLEVVDVVAGRPLSCRVYNASPEVAAAPLKVDSHAPIPEDLFAIVEPFKFREEPYYRPVSNSFLERCAEVVRILSSAFTISRSISPNLVTQPPMKVGVMMTEGEDGTRRIAVKNSAPVYARVSVKPEGGAESVTVRSGFPVTLVKPEEGAFPLIIPPFGVVVVDVEPSKGAI